MKQVLAFVLGLISCLFAICSTSFAAEIAFTVDDLPRTSSAPINVSRAKIANAMIKAFKKKGVPQVWGFINAKKMEKNPDDIQILNAWRNAGYPLGNHSYSHMNLNDFTPTEFISDILSNEPFLQKLMGKENYKLFRYPYLHEGESLEKRQEVRKQLKQNGYQIAQVTIDFEDWLWNEPYARCKNKKDKKGIKYLKKTYLEMAMASLQRSLQLSQLLFGRDIQHILLLHIGAFDSVMLPDLLQVFLNEGHTFITLESALNDELYSKDPNIALNSGDTFLDQWMKAKGLPYPKPSIVQPYKELEALCL